jgi:hypothetical protein
MSVVEYFVRTLSVKPTGTVDFTTMSAPGRCSSTNRITDSTLDVSNVSASGS